MFLTQQNSSSSSSQQAAKMATVAGFISEIQDSLSNEAFQRFKKALAAYKEVSLQQQQWQ